MNNFLNKIKKLVKNRVSRMPDYPVLSQNQHDFLMVFNNNNKPVIISEIKFASPSLGRIHVGDLNHIAIAKSYLQAGSDAISILTEPYFFQGDVHYLRDIRHEFTESNLLLKDFVLSKKQVRQAAYFGANAILLIKSILSESDLKDLYEYAVSLSLTPIVEVHDLSELRAVSKLSPKIIGINNRSLNTLNVDMNISRELIKHAPKSSYLVCESGVKSRCQIDEMHALGFDGFLVGSSLMKSDSPGRALTTLLEREMKTC